MLIRQSNFLLPCKLNRYPRTRLAATPYRHIGLSLQNHIVRERNSDPQRLIRMHNDTLPQKDYDSGRYR